MRSLEAKIGAPAAGAVVLFVVSISLVGCGADKSSTTTRSSASLGTPMDEEVPMVCTGCISEENAGEIVAIEGKIVQQCPASGCWFRMKDDAGEAFVDLAPAKLRLESNRVGQHAKATGRVVKKSGQFRIEAQHVELTPANNTAPSNEE